jgi:hypothetical protein
MSCTNKCLSIEAQNVLNLIVQNDDFDSQYQELIDTYQTEVRNRNEQMLNTVYNHTAEVKQRHSEMDKLIDIHQAEIDENDAVIAQMQTTIKNHKADMSDLITYHETQTNDSSNQHEVRKNDLIARHEVHINNLHFENEVNYKEAIAGLEGKFERRKFKYDNKNKELIERNQLIELEIYQLRTTIEQLEKKKS